MITESVERTSSIERVPSVPVSAQSRRSSHHVVRASSCGGRFARRAQAIFRFQQRAFSPPRATSGCQPAEKCAFEAHKHVAISSEVVFTSASFGGCVTFEVDATAASFGGREMRSVVTPDIIDYVGDEEDLHVLKKARRVS
jgi:hypothetical protein